LESDDCILDFLGSGHGAAPVELYDVNDHLAGHVVPTFSMHLPSGETSNSPMKVCQCCLGFPNPLPAHEPGLHLRGAGHDDHQLFSPSLLDRAGL
jgi:hypothetical protein